MSEDAKKILLANTARANRPPVPPSGRGLQAADRANRPPVSGPKVKPPPKPKK